MSAGTQVGPDRRGYQLLLTCEHGGNTVPDEWRTLFAGEEMRLASHRGWDPGALDAARTLAEALEAPLISATTTRLLVDLNRSPGHRNLFSPVTRPLPAADRARILREHYHPWRERVESTLERMLALGPVLHVSVHSFTPVLDGRFRRVDIGLLYDPSRNAERRFCADWHAALRASQPALRIRRNQPYRGTADGFTRWLRRRHPDPDYAGIELELNQALVPTTTAATALATPIAAALGRTAIAGPTPPTS